MFKNSEKNINLVLRLKKEKADINYIISILKQEGITQRDSVYAIKNALQIPLKKADELVLQSEAWKNTLNETVNFRNSFGDFLESYLSEEE